MFSTASVTVLSAANDAVLNRRAAEAAANSSFVM
jgi:hypothetical protein